MQQKIKQPDILAQLKLDGLLFDHIYSDLMMLVKSQKLNKSALDMNIHYLELKGFLEELTQDPQQIINPNYEVFPSEPRLYGVHPLPTTGFTQDTALFEQGCISQICSTSQNCILE